MSDYANTPLEGYNYWGSFEKYSVHDWIYEVRNGDTRRGYWSWVHACMERDVDEKIAADRDICDMQNKNK